MKLTEQMTAKLMESSLDGEYVKSLRTSGAAITPDAVVWLKNKLGSSNAGSYNQGIAVLGLIPKERYEEIIKQYRSGPMRSLSSLLIKFRDIADSQRTGENKWASIYKESKTVHDGQTSYVYKGYKLRLVDVIGNGKWYNVWKGDEKINQERNLSTLAKAKKFVDSLKLGESKLGKTEQELFDTVKRLGSYTIVKSDYRKREFIAGLALIKKNLVVFEKVEHETYGQPLTYILKLK
jgi:hypothetical protein